MGISTPTTPQILLLNSQMYDLLQMGTETSMGEWATYQPKTPKDNPFKIKQSNFFLHPKQHRIVYSHTDLLPLHGVRICDAVCLNS